MLGLLWQVIQSMPLGSAVAVTSGMPGKSMCRELHTFGIGR